MTAPTAFEFEPEPPEPATPLVRYPTPDSKIRELAVKFKDLAGNVRTPEGYDRVKLALKELVPVRTGIEKWRSTMKAGALEYGRKIDAEAKRITALVKEVEQPLLDAKWLVDNEEAKKAREAAEAVAAEEKRLADQKREEEAAKLWAENQRLAEERRKLDAERAKLAEEQRQIAAEQRREQDRIDQQRRDLEAEQRATQAEKDRIALEEFHRKQQAELDLATERQRAADALRREQLRPDREKLTSFGAELMQWWSDHAPTGLSEDAVNHLTNVRSRLVDLIAELHDFAQ